MKVLGKNDYADGRNITQNVLEEEADGGREDGLDLSSRLHSSTKFNSMKHVSIRYYHKTL